MELKEIIEQKRAAAANLRVQQKIQRDQEQVAREQHFVDVQTQNVAPRPVVIKQEIAPAIPPLSLNALVAKKRKRPGITHLAHQVISLIAAEADEPFGDSSLPQPTQSKSPRLNPTVSDNENRIHIGEETEILNGAAKNPFAPERKGPRKKAVYKHREVVQTSKILPEWYLNTKMNQKFSRGDLQTISHVKSLIANCVDAVNNEGDTELHFSALRKKIHEMEFFEFLSPILVKKSKVLEDGGLTQIFDGPNKALFPWDIVADAEALWLRWMGGDLDASLLRGITVEKGILSNGAKRTSYKLQKEYLQRKSANVVGPNDLVNGQWWPSRICALRDGAHGEQEAGIHGQTDKGAYSVVVATGGYADKDNGETIEYCGTKSENSTPTKSTALLQDSFIKKQPLRVLRAVNKQSKYAPKEGIRYDGMYEIADQEILDPMTAMFRFSLKRIEGQDPIRYRGVEVRPTDLELKERMKIREFLA